MAGAVDISGLPPPPAAGNTAAEPDVSHLPPPTQAAAGPDIGHLPAPPQAVAADISGLPPPPKSPEDTELTARNAVRPEEVRAIAAKHGLSEDQTQNLQSVLPYLGAHEATPEAEQGVGGVVTGAKQAVGTVGRALGNLPQFAAKKLLSKPEQKAWDELQELATSRTPTSLKVGRTVGGFGVAAATGTLGEGATGAAATGALWGAASGLGESKTGDEAKGAAEGAVLGVAGGLVLHGAAAGLSKLISASAENRVVRDIAPVVEAALQRPEAQAEARAGFANARAAVQGAESHELQPFQHVAEEAHARLEANPSEFTEALEANPELASAAPAQAKQEVARREALAAAHADTVRFADWLDRRGLPRGAAGDTAAEPRITTVDKALDRIRSWAANGQGERDLSEEYGHFKAVEATQHAFADAVERGQVTKSGPITSFIRSLARAPSMMGIIDDRSGSTLEPLINTLGRKVSQAMNEAYGFQTELESTVLQPLRAAGHARLDAAARGAIESGDFSGVSDEAAAGLRRLAELNEKFRQHVNAQAGEELLPRIEGVAAYVPRVLQDTQGVMTSVLRTARQAGLTLGDRALTGADLAASRERNPEAFQELRQQLLYLTGEFPEEAAQLERGLRQATDPNGVDRLLSVKRAGLASGAFRERGDVGIPASLLEQDISRAQSQYFVGALRDVHTRSDMRAFAAEAAKLEAAGDLAGAKYARTWLADQLGTGTAKAPAWLSKQRASVLARASDAADRLEAAGSGAQAAALRALVRNSDLPTLAVQSLYPSLLGFNVHTILKATVTPLTTMFPELLGSGSNYGASVMLGAAARAGKQLATEGRGALSGLREAGWMPTHISSQVRDAFQAGMGRSAVGRGFRSGVQHLADASLLGLQAAEGASRLVALHTGDILAEHLFAGRREALQYLDQVGRGYRAQVNGALSAMRAAEARGDTAAVTELQNRVRTLVKEDFVTRTVHQYTPLHMSEVGRQWGRIVGALSTWPSALTTNIVRDVQRRGLVGAGGATLRRYVAPLMMLEVAQQLGTAAGWDPQSDRSQAALGKGGLPGLAPAQEVPLLGAAARIATGEAGPGGRGGSPLRAPPMVSDLYQAMGNVAQMDPDGFFKAMNLVGSHYGMGANAVLRLAEFISTELTGHKPEGKTPAGQALEMIRPGMGQRLEEQFPRRGQ